MKKTQKDFLVDLVKYEKGLIGKAVSTISSEELAKNLIYFVEKQKSEDKEIRGLASDLALRIERKDLIRFFNYLAKCQRSDNENVRSLSSRLLEKITAAWTEGQIISHLVWLINCKGGKPYDFKKTAEALIDKLPNKVLKNMVPVFKSFKDAKNLRVKYFAMKYALKGIGQMSDRKMAKQYDYLLFCYEYSKKNERKHGQKAYDCYHEAVQLVLKVMCHWPVNRLKRNIDFLFKCSWRDPKRELVLKVMETWPLKKREEKIDYLIRTSLNGVVSISDAQQKMAFEIMDGWSQEKLAERYEFLLLCQDSKYPESVEKARELSLKIDPKLLIEQIDFYVYRTVFHLRDNPNIFVRSFAYMMALRIMDIIPTKALTEYLKFIIDCQERNDDEIRASAWKIAEKIDAEGLDNNFGEILHTYRFSDGAKEELTKKLLDKLESDILVKKLEDLIDAADSEHGGPTRDFILSLIFKIKIKDLAKKIDVLINGKKVNTNWYVAAIYRLLAMRVMQRWPLEKLVKFDSYIIKCANMEYHSPEYKKMKAIAVKLKSKIDSFDESKKVVEDIRNMIKA